MRRVADFLGISFSETLLQPTFLGRPIHPNSSFAIGERGLNPTMLDRTDTLKPEDLRYITENAMPVFEEARAAFELPKGSQGEKGAVTRPPSVTSEPPHFAGAVVDSLCGALQQAKIETDPFDYTIVGNVFPADAYKVMQANLPASENYMAMSGRRTGNRNAQKNRLRLNLTSPEFERLSETERACWGKVRDAICDPRFVKLVFKRFGQGLGRRYGDTTLDLQIRVELFRDFHGFQVAPHTDAPHKIFTLIFYLPTDSENVDLGTAVYVPKDRSLTDEKSHQMPFDQFEEVRRAPFLPNTMFGFMKSDRSFHGRPPVDRTVERNMINVTFQHAENYVS